MNAQIFRDMAVVLAGLGTPLLAILIFRVYDEYFKAKESKSAKSVADQIDAFQRLAEINVKKSQEEAALLTEMINRLNFSCRRFHEDHNLLDQVPKAGQCLWYLVENESQPVALPFKSGLGKFSPSSSSDGWYPFEEYQLELEKQLELLGLR